MKRLLLSALTIWAGVLITFQAWALQTVRIVNIGHGYYAGPLYIAIHEKLFEKHGLQADVSFVQGGALVFQAVFAREADFGLVS